MGNIVSHRYSQSKNSNNQLTKVGRMVFKTQYQAEHFCTKNGLDVTQDIEYADTPELKRQVLNIAQYQKAILRYCLNLVDSMFSSVRKEIDIMSKQLDNAHFLEEDFFKDCVAKAIGKLDGIMAAREVIKNALTNLEQITGWHN